MKTHLVTVLIGKPVQPTDRLTDWPCDKRRTHTHILTIILNEFLFSVLLLIFILFLAKLCAVCFIVIIFDFIWSFMILFSQFFSLLFILIEKEREKKKC